MNVLITGVGTGIGKATCLHFLKQGFTVVGVLRNQKHLKGLVTVAGSLSSNLKIITADLENSNFSDKVFKQLKELNISSIDVLLNIAGVLDTTAVSDFEVTSVNKVMMVNFVSPSMLISRLLPLIEANKPGNIVNITSMSGFPGSVRFPSLAVYGASKAALGSLTESLAAEFTENGVHINALAIGSVNTEMLQKAFPDFESSISPSDMAEYIYTFATIGYKFHNGKVLSVAITNP
ncbi:MAG: NAD(P)-dependent dehydrogenase (short-subunit alcohol dehydrogenase family) [Salibacteraceae bacterium]|jgi:NAD(P)-dependent dehydrogenase (short-subunit alcohol dehydrogenase family)